LFSQDKIVELKVKISRQYATIAAKGLLSKDAPEHAISSMADFILNDGMDRPGCLFGTEWTRVEIYTDDGDSLAGIPSSEITATKALEYAGLFSQGNSVHVEFSDENKPITMLPLSVLISDGAVVAVIPAKDVSSRGSNLK
jgi:hypothetical protein